MTVRPLHATPTEGAAEAMGRFHAHIVQQVTEAVAQHDVVVVGMALNPHVKRARRALDEAGIPHHDLDFGGYHAMWRERLAIKLWSGWPTFPQVFVKGRLLGGASETIAALKEGVLAELVQA